MTIVASLSTTLTRSPIRRSGWIGTSPRTFPARSRTILRKLSRAVATSPSQVEFFLGRKSFLRALTASISCRSTSLGSPTIATSAGTCQPMRVGVASICTYVALSVQVGGWPNFSPLQKRKPIGDHQVGPAGERFFPGALHGQRVVFAERAVAGAARVDRRARQLGQLGQLGGGARPEDAVAADQQRPLAVGQQVDGALDRARVALRAKLVGLVHLGAGHLVGLFVLVVEDVGRNLEHRDALRRRHGLAKGLSHVERNAIPVEHAVRELAERAADVGAVGFLKRAQAVFAERMLARQADHGAVGQSGDAQAGHGVGQSAAGRDAADAGRAGGAGPAVGRIGRGLLVPHVDQLDAVVLADWPGSETGGRR